MKSNIRLLTLFLLFTTSCVILPRQTEAQQTNVSFQVFYDQLSPYGQWIDYSNYGYVWIPDAGADFVPYSTDGHWVFTDYGWTWASDYIWGWATFHYGRWSYADSFGWFWIPDNEWGPAWVNWRQADGYYGWSPMEPGVSVSMSFGRSYDSHNDHWLFVRNNDFERTDIHNYYVNNVDRNRIVRHSTVINTTYIDRSRRTIYVSGPTRESVQRATGRTIRPLSIQENNKPGQEVSNGQLRIYRPEIQKRNSGQQNAPTKVTDIRDVKRTPVRNASNQNQVGTPDNRQVTSPANRVVPQNNNVPQIQQPNRNQQDNNQNRENRTLPAVESQKVRTIEQSRQSTPTDNTRPDKQPVVAPQNKPVQPVQSKPVQQRNVTPQNNNQPQQRNVNQQPNNKPVQQNIPAAVEKNKPQIRQNQPTNKVRNNTTPKQHKPVKQQIKVEQAKVPDAVSSDRK
jgi:hypothetical protein